MLSIYGFSMFLIAKGRSKQINKIYSNAYLYTILYRSYNKRKLVDIFWAFLMSGTIATIPE